MGTMSTNEISKEDLQFLDTIHALESTLILAASNGRTSAVDLLATKFNANGMTSLMWAFRYGKHKVVTFLVTGGNAKRLEAVDSNGKTALMWAAENDHTRIEEILNTKRKANPAADACYVYSTSIYITTMDKHTLKYMMIDNSTTTKKRHYFQYANRDKSEIIIII